MDSNVLTICSLLIIVGAVIAIIRHFDVRLVLFTAGLLIASLAGDPLLVFKGFQEKMGDESIIAPICSAMGYAFVLRAIGADKEMVRLLITPIRRIRFLLIPGGCLIGFFTNMAITSQTATAAAVGPILIPIMIAARWHPIIAGATLVLGCSAGGNLFNPGEPDIVTINRASGIAVPDIINAAIVPEISGFLVAVIVFTIFSYMFTPKEEFQESEFHSEEFLKTKINIAKALLPPLPIILLMCSQPSFSLFTSITLLFPSGIPVLYVMIFSTIIAIIVAGGKINEKAEQFFEGIGYGFTHVISLIITASCFISSLEAVGLVGYLVRSVQDFGILAKFISGIIPYTFAVLSGSGTTPSVAFTKAVVPALSQINTTGAVDIGILGAIGASFGRTMSPAAAVVIFATSLCHIKPLHIVKRTAPALLCGFIAVLIIMFLR